MRTIIIGDIHGCSGALRMLLAKIMPNPKEDKLILLGDLFDRGPDSWGVFQMVRELADTYGGKSSCRCPRGLSGTGSGAGRQ